MQTNFSLAQLADSDMQASERILRACVHCGFCTATCPTYVLLGDELDSPRGRIYLMKQMFEEGQPATEEVVKHIDRCLSCLACMTTCPSGVHYMHLVDHGRRHIEATYRRPAHDRWLRALLAAVLPRPALFRLALIGAWVGRPVGRLLPARLRAMLALAPKHLPSPSGEDRAGVFPAEGVRRGRVALLAGCAQRVLAPETNQATIRILNRHGIEVVVSKDAGCCGALTHHLGKEAPALNAARANIGAWCREIEDGGLDAIIINASGCGTTVKDYGFMLRDDPEWSDRAGRIAMMTRDITEYLLEIGMKPAVRDLDLAVTYHSACSMQHGQRLTTEPKALLADAGFTVRDVPEGHLCCGSAGTYNLLQPELAGRLKERKLANIEKTRPDVIATGNIGCITQLADGAPAPVVHTVELLDWATGGPPPKGLADHRV